MRKFFRVIAIAGICLAVSATTFAAAFRLGDEGREIAEIQSALSNLGYDIDIDGKFGPATKAAIMEFQSERGLTIDGIAGSEVYRALLGKELPQKTSRGDNLRARSIINSALGFMGVPYVYGGASPSGFDCSGFVYYVFGQAGVSLPRTADTQFYVGTPVEKSELRAGDLVFFSADFTEPSHVGIYLKDGDFVHASTEYGIAIDSLYRDYRVAHYVGARRII